MICDNFNTRSYEILLKLKLQNHVTDLWWRAVCLKSDLSSKSNMNKEELSQT